MAEPLVLISVNSLPRLMPAYVRFTVLPWLVVLCQALSSLVGVVCDLGGGSFKDLLEFWLQALHDGVNGLWDLLEFGQSFDQDPHKLGAVLLWVRV